MDTYSLRARILPAVLTVLPLYLGLEIFLPGSLVSLRGLGTAVVWLALSYLIAQVVRDLGVNAQKRLYEQWGGAPTTRLLRLAPVPEARVLQRRQALSKLFPSLKWPTEEVEHSDVRSLDQVAEHAIEQLREQTRDRKEFGLLFQENVSYGFRRNLYGLKPFATGSAVLGIASGLRGLFQADGVASVEAWAATVVSLFLLALLTLTVSPNWVQVAGDRYAQQLFAAAESLTGKERSG